MTAKIKFVFTALFVGLLSGKSLATEIDTKAQAGSSDPCMTLAHYDFEKTTNALTTFRMDIFGKNPERWTVEDIKNLTENVIACDGKPLNVSLTYRVSAGNWRRALDNNRIQAFLETANRSTRLAGQYESAWPKSLKMPYCADLLKWNRDPIWYTNNAEEIFGQTFYGLNETDGVIIAKYVEACQPVLSEILKARQLEENLAEEFVKDITSSLKRDQSAAFWDGVELVPEFKLEKDGKPIPLAYLSQPTRDIVIKLNTALKSNVILNTDALGVISTWIGDMNRANVKGPDAVYVQAIKNVVSNQLFQQEQKYDDVKP